MPDVLKRFLESLKASDALEVYDYLDQIVANESVEEMMEIVEEMMEIVAETVSRS